MSRIQMLNNVTHKDLRIITKKSPEFGDNVAGALIFPEEFMDVQKEYPIFFQKDEETGEFQAVAIFGFKQDENLFLNEQGWQGYYIPAVIEREPFLIGFQASATTDTDKEPVIHIDTQSPRISKTDEGTAVFLPQGGNTAYIDNISKALLLIHEGLTANRAMFAEFLALDLLESFTLNIEFNNAEQYQATNYYTINQEKFFALTDAPLANMHQRGYLHYGSMVISSLGNIKKLIARRNAML